ncbi:DUF4160 domain-containing protein [Sandaracinobacteroides saxicola]|uniref:DUF4160 domain-containing protein n=1 Tax=Sandaracinobacteroides saxicola TaxID=2759707 RepID=A0A7G5IES1_9SPHN|nr:DUF4160 domain-containing protein [Sandaracinobacteroides saxicola]QMW21863.1 DUF4160 domain-containing protein [Sandaracinobacteroides saxicola]
MVTIHRQGGLSFVIYLDDHAPAHVHVVGDGHAKVDLAGPMGGPVLVRAHGFGAGDLRRAMAIISERQDEFLRRWRAIHG